jgi:hypothetical protein
VKKKRKKRKRKKRKRKKKRRKKKRRKRKKKDKVNNHLGATVYFINCKFSSCSFKLFGETNVYASKCIFANQRCITLFQYIVL